MGFFHKHSLTTFTCNASELQGIKLIDAVEIGTNKKMYFDVTHMSCPRHKEFLRPQGDCPICSFQGKPISLPNLKDVIIEFTTCQKCNYFKVTAQCGKYKYSVNNEWVKLRIVQIKKEKEDAELERLLNFNNPDYKKEENSKNNDQTVQEYAEAIQKLQKTLKVVVDKLNESLKMTVFGMLYQKKLVKI